MSNSETLCLIFKHIKERTEFPNMKVLYYVMLVTLSTCHRYQINQFICKHLKFPEKFFF